MIATVIALDPSASPQGDQNKSGDRNKRYQGNSRSNNEDVCRSKI